MRGSWLIWLMLAVATPVHAEELPRFDVRVVCAAERAATAGKAGGCQRAEEAARRVITARWETYPKQRKHFCVQSVTFRRQDQRSYVSLAECLDDPAITS